MTDVTVGFRVTGMYFGAGDSVTKSIEVTVPSKVGGKNNSVVAIMAAVADKVSRDEIDGVTSFAYSPARPTTSDFLNEIIVQYTQSPKSGLNPGGYSLVQNLQSNPQQVWQYYHYSRDFRQKNTNNVFVPYGAPLENELEDGDIIVWRMVAILQQSNANSRLHGAQIKRSMDAILATRDE